MTRRDQDGQLAQPRRQTGSISQQLAELLPFVGKLSAIAKGARRSASRLAAATEPFTFSRVMLAVGQNLDVLTQAEVRAPFQEIRALRMDDKGALYVAALSGRGPSGAPATTAEDRAIIAEF